MWRHYVQLRLDLVSILASRTSDIRCPSSLHVMNTCFLPVMSLQLAGLLYPVHSSRRWGSLDRVPVCALFWGLVLACSCMLTLKCEICNGIAALHGLLDGKVLLRT